MAALHAPMIKSMPRKVEILAILAAPLLLGACSPQTEVARVPVSNSALVLVLKEDEKRMTRYVLELRGDPVSSEGFLGPGGGVIGRNLNVSTEGGAVRIAWGEQAARQFVVIDTTACRVAKHSNAGAAPPSMRRCQ